MHTENFTTAGCIILAVLLTVTACDRKDRSRAGSFECDTTGGILRLSPLMAEQRGIATAKMEIRDMEGPVGCTGIMEALPQNIADVTVPVGGLVKACLRQPGDHVEAGQCIAILEHPDYIKMQQEYLETKSRWEFYREDFKRQGELTVENAASIKTMQEAQASFKATEVRLFALRSQLNLLGIDADSLHTDNISSVVRLAAPVSGTITDMDIHLGSYVGPERMACRIVNKNRLCLLLSVDEKHIRRIRPGQKTVFSLPGNPTESFTARVMSVAPSPEPGNETFLVRAGIMENRDWFYPGLKVRASVHTAASPCMTLPGSAIVTDEDGALIFIQTGEGYKPVSITTGLTNDSVTEILAFPDGIHDSDIVTQGASWLDTLYFHR